MIHPDDVTAWIAQVRQQPQAAPEMIKMLAARLLELDQQNEALRDELLRLRQRPTTERADERVATLSQRVETLQHQLVHGKETVHTLLVLTLDGRGARLPLSVSPKGASQTLVAAHLRPRYVLPVSEGASLLLFSDQGRSLRLSSTDIDLADQPVNYLSLLPGLLLDLDESITAVVPLEPGTAYHQLTLVSRKGYARSFRAAEVDSMLERNLPLHSSPVEGDYPVLALPGDGKGELLIATRQGKGVRFAERLVGVRSEPALRLERGDVVVGAARVDEGETVLVMGQDGCATCRQMGGFAAHPSAGHAGKILSRISEVVDVACVAPGDDLWTLTTAGRLMYVPLEKIPRGPGASSGKEVIKLQKDERVVTLVAAPSPAGV